MLNHYVNKSFNQQEGQIQDIENQEHKNQEKEYDCGNIDHEDFEIENPMFNNDSNDDVVEEEEEESDFPSLSDEKVIEKELEENQEDLDQVYEDKVGDEVDEQDEVVQQQKQNKGRGCNKWS
jgi:hypothetical protein